MFDDTFSHYHNIRIICQFISFNSVRNFINNIFILKILFSQNAVYQIEIEYRPIIFNVEYCCTIFIQKSHLLVYSKAYIQMYTWVCQLYFHTPCGARRVKSKVKGLRANLAHK